MYDSVDDDESGNEGDEYVIDPEKKIIAFFDFLMLAIFFKLFHFHNIFSNWRKMLLFIK